MIFPTRILRYLIANLETSRVTIEKEQRAIAAYKDEIAALKAKLETKQDNIAKQKEQILRRANEQASKILQDAKDFADRTIRDMNKLGVGDNKALEQKRTAVREKLDNVNKHLNIKSASKQKSLSAKDFKIRRFCQSPLPECQWYCQLPAGC